MEDAVAAMAPASFAPSPSVEQEIREALELFAIANTELEELEALTSRFNTFEALGVVRQELRHSDFLEFLLNPRQPHGLGDAFARRLLQQAIHDNVDKPTGVNALDLELWSLSDLQVRREWQNIDILLLDRNAKLAVVIENKVDSGEHSNQLDRYWDEAGAHYPGHQRIGIYLTPDGEPATDGHDHYLTLSYRAICEVLKGLVTLRAGSIEPEVKRLIEHYIEMVGRHLLADTTIAELCRRIYDKHQRALDLIFEHKPDRQLAIKELLVSIIEDEPALMLEQASKQWILFFPQSWSTRTALTGGSGWTSSGRLLMFQFENFSASLNLKLVLGPGPTESRKRVFDAARTHGPLFKPSRRELGASWNTLVQRSFLTSQDYEAGDIEALTTRIQERWGAFRDTDLPEIVRVIEGCVDNPSTI